VVSELVAVSITFAVSVEVLAAVRIAVTLEIFKGLVIITVATGWCHYYQRYVLTYV
jgi:hypothetical protein